MAQAIDASFNVAIGGSALRQNVSGTNTVAIGLSALRENLGTENIAIGASAPHRNVNGSNNIAIGFRAGYDNLTGKWVPVGTEAEPFAAAFEGNGRVIRHLLVAGGEGAGLFGCAAARRRGLRRSRPVRAAVATAAVDRAGPYRGRPGAFDAGVQNRSTLTAHALDGHAVVADGQLAA